MITCQRRWSYTNVNTCYIVAGATVRDLSLTRKVHSLMLRLLNTHPCDRIQSGDARSHEIVLVLIHLNWVQPIIHWDEEREFWEFTRWFWQPALKANIKSHLYSLSQHISNNFTQRCRHHMGSSPKVLQLFHLKRIQLRQHQQNTLEHRLSVFASQPQFITSTQKDFIYLDQPFINGRHKMLE